LSFSCSESLSGYEYGGDFPRFVFAGAQSFKHDSGKVRTILRRIAFHAREGLDEYRPAAAIDVRPCDHANILRDAHASGQKRHQRTHGKIVVLEENRIGKPAASFGGKTRTERIGGKTRYLRSGDMAAGALEYLPFLSRAP
jgi:hypothetical protein